ncbi:AAA family ATPase [Candidatus Woesearchaeota archaeon]|nr:AAA family ATPase [Candidatus Woesearchaeota archaeon]
MSDGKIIGVISIKGGVGKTTTVSNLGAVFYKEFGKKTLIIDTNFTAPNLALHLGLVDPETTIHDVLRNKADITDAIYEHEFGFHIIPASLLNVKVNPFKLKEKIQKLRNIYDIILLDSSPNLTGDILATMVASDELLVVTSPDYPTLSCSMNAIKVAKSKKAPITGLILNRTRGKHYELSLNDIEDATGVPVLAVLPDDHKVSEALANTIPAALHAPAREVSFEYRKLAAALLGQQFEDKRILPKFKKMLNKGCGKHDINREVIRSERFEQLK